MLEWLFGKKKQEPKQKQKKSKKQEETQDKWMYDFMVQFLLSPLWQITILDFVDSKCVVFDNEEQNKFQYTIIHNVLANQIQEFKEIVGNMVDGMMEEIGMSQQKLAQMIQIGLESKQKKVFNQLLLADDFLRFKELMIRRNKILQQEALKALNQSKIKGSASPEQKKSKNNELEAELLRESKRMEEERQKKIEQEEEEMLRKAIQMSKIESKQTEAIKALEEKAVDRVQQKIEQKSIEEAKQKTNIKSKPTSRLEPLKGSQSSARTSKLGELPPLKSSLQKTTLPKPEEELIEPVHKKIEEVKTNLNKPTEETKSAQQSEQVVEKEQSESLQDRKQRLMAQREKIRKQKEEQRKKLLEQDADVKEKQSQPVVKTIVLQEEGFFDETSAKKQPIKGEQSNVSEDELKRRKELMNKIKNRIIDDF